MRSLKERKRAWSWVNWNPHRECFFFPAANLAESEAGSNQNLTGFKTDSLGRMDDSEASNKGFYVQNGGVSWDTHNVSCDSSWFSSDTGHHWTNLIGFLRIHFWFCWTVGKVHKGLATYITIFQNVLLKYLRSTTTTVKHSCLALLKIHESRTVKINHASPLWYTLFLMFFNSRVERIYVSWKLTHFCRYSGSTGEGNDDKNRESVPE